MPNIFDLLRGLLLVLLGGGLILFFFYSWLKNTREDRTVLVIKWITSLVTVITMLMLSKDAGPFMVIVALIGGMVLAILWTPSVADWVVGKVDDLFTGGSDEVDPAPFYSMAEGRRKRGDYDAALAEIQRQLERFPDDLQGHLLLAEIHARDLHDLATAHAVIEDYCATLDRPPAQAVPALTLLADWHLDLGNDPEAAVSVLRQITAQWPGSAEAKAAEQRISRLAQTDQVKAAKDRTPIRLKTGVKDVGLTQDTPLVGPAEEDAETTIANLAIHLESFPNDVVAREQLAELYSNHYKDVELVREQLEFLIRLPGTPARQQVRWLNLLADFEIHHAQSYETVCATLQRIVDMDPGNAAAHQARQRMSHVRLDLKAHEKSRVVKLGSHDMKEGLPPET